MGRRVGDLDADQPVMRPMRPMQLMQTTQPIQQKIKQTNQKPVKSGLNALPHIFLQNHAHLHQVMRVC